MDDLLRWAASHGVALHNAAIAPIPGRGMGVVATATINSGDLVLSIPHSLLITRKTDVSNELGETNHLAFTLQKELYRGRESQWLPYVTSLPKSFSTPLFFNESERALLHGTEVASWTLKREDTIVRTHRSFDGSIVRQEIPLTTGTGAGTQSPVNEIVGGAGTQSRANSIDVFKWALSVAWSRGFAVSMHAVASVSGTRRRPGLVPIGDAFNHADEASAANIVTTSDPARGVFDFVATRRIEASEEMLISYSLQGEPSNSKLLLDYGFCTPYSLHDEVSLDLSVDTQYPDFYEYPDDPDYGDPDPDGVQREARRELLRALKLDKYAPTARLSLDSADPPHELIATGRVLELHGSALLAATAQSVLGAQEMNFEASALRFLAYAIERRLEEYRGGKWMGRCNDAWAKSHQPGTREYVHHCSSMHRFAPSNEDDEHELASGEWRRTGGSACALHVRAGERRVLLHWWRRLHTLAAQAESATAGQRYVHRWRTTVWAGNMTKDDEEEELVNKEFEQEGVDHYREMRMGTEPRRAGDSAALATGEVDKPEASDPPLQVFVTDAIGWDLSSDMPLPAMPDPVSLEVRTLAHKADHKAKGRHARGVVVAHSVLTQCTNTCIHAHNSICEDGSPGSSSPRLPACAPGTDCRDCGPQQVPGSRLRLGDLAGCYSGALIGPDERAAKRPTGFEAYCFPINSSHVVDPTDANGRVDSATPHQMALVNEPTGDQMPNLTPMDYRYGLCRDRDDRPGVPYYAVRDILPGEALTVCYGPGFGRSYETVCSNRRLLGRWTELQARLLRPLISR